MDFVKFGKFPKNTVFKTEALFLVKLALLRASRCKGCLVSAMTPLQLHIAPDDRTTRDLLPDGNGLPFV